MAISLEQFVAQLDESGVISAAEIAAFQQSQSPAAESAEDLGKLLVKHKKVTKLQARMVYQGKGDRLLLGNYLILDKIGAGGMGDVYLAEHRRMERRVALKTLPAAMTRETQSIQRFHREVKAAAKLSHPNIVAAYDADEANGVHYFVMEYVEGVDLSAVVKKRGVLQVDVAVDYILQAAKGLEFAHNKGVIHRDIKPANMLLDNEGTIKILDMGLARIEDEAHEIPATQLTQDGSVMGTVDYMAPEQAKDTHTADARSDIYSLGCSLYYLLTGESVYRGSTIVNRIMAHQNDPIPSLTSSLVHIPSDLDAVYQKMIAKRPEDRFQSMSEVIVALENCIQMKSSSTVSEEPSDPELHKFLQSQKFASSPTVVMSADAMAAEKPLTDTQNESLTSGFLNHTLGGTVFQPLQKRMQSIGKRGWILMGAVLAPLILIAGIVFKIDTPAGTIVLEIDQPELAGAVVSVDDQKKITIKTGEGKEPIEVVADEKTHTLQVTKGGFETFTKQFTVKAGGKETIKVRLEPLVVATKKKPSMVKPATTSEKSMTDREIAEWVIGKGGTIGIDGNTIYSKVEELPTEPVKFAVIKLKDASLKDDDLVPLANVRTLRALYLDFNPLHDTGLKYLKGLDQLETLSIPNTEITDKGLSHFKELPKLRDLNVASSSITNSGMKAIGDLKQLDTLKIAMNSQIDDTGLGYIERLTKLEKLYAHVAPRITDEGLKHLKGMKLLSVLTLATTGITDAGLEQLAGFENLSELDITNCKITDSGLEHLKGSKNLKKLTLNMTPVTDLGLQHLHGLKKLESLNLQETKVTPQGIADLQKALPNCKIVSDFGNKLPPPEKDNYALEFDGKDDYVVIDEFNLPSMKESDQFTVEVRCLLPEPNDQLAMVIWVNKCIKIFSGASVDGKTGGWRCISRSEIDKKSVIPFATKPTDHKRFMHLAAVWDGKLLRFFTDGERYGFGTPVPPPLEKGDNKIYLGAEQQTNKDLNMLFKGSIDEVRISDIARYTKDFTPAKRFKIDEHTMALYHFDEAEGDVLKDSSGNGHAGKIVGAKWVKVDDELQVTEPATKSEKPMTDREFAKWILSLGGTIRVNNKEGRISRLEDLPKEPFFVISISFGENKSMTDHRLQSLKELKQLEKLYIEATPATNTGMQHLAQLTSLTGLDISFTSVGDEGLRYLAGLEKLTYLSVQATKITDVGLKHLTNLRNLTSLNLNVTMTGDQGLEYIKNLINLTVLNGGKLTTDEGLKHLSQMKQLQRISFDATRVTGSGLVHLPDPEKLVNLNLQGSPVTDENLQNVSKFTNLQVLYLRGTKITDAGLKYLESLKQLKNLTLQETKITDTGLKHLESMKRLESLNLQKTKVTPQGIADLQKALPTCKIVSDFETKPPATKAP